MSSDWNLVQTATGDALVKQFDRGDFKGSVALLDQILPLAEAADHHPAIQLDSGTETVTLTSHSEGSLVTQKDHDLAAQIDALT